MFPETLAKSYRRKGEVLASINPCGNPGTLGARLYPISLNPPDARGNISEKRGIRAGMKGQSPAGFQEVIFSDVTAA